MGEGNLAESDDGCVQPFLTNIKSFVRMRQKRKREQFLMQIYFFVCSLKWHKKGKHEQNNRKITEKLYRFKHECSWIKNKTESNLYNILHCTWLRKIKMNEQNIKLQKLFIISVKLTRIVALNHIFLFSSPIFPYHSRFFSITLLALLNLIGEIVRER